MSVFENRFTETDVGDGRLRTPDFVNDFRNGHFLIALLTVYGGGCYVCPSLKIIWPYLLKLFLIV
jgi:hypothetical protein